MIAAALLAGLLVGGAPVEVGLEVFSAGDRRLVAGKRLGLVAHAASVTLDGRHTLGVLRAGGANVVRLFAPEHGWLGNAAAGESLADARDPGSGLPIVSLYGASRRPSPADLWDLDALVVDLQDVGVRFYSYESTLLLCLEAAAEAGIELIVLDRPNPLGGERIAGPLASEASRAAFLSLAPGPLLHGLTMGELALYANRLRARPAKLQVVAMRRWRRSMSWADSGRPWLAPSPNLRSPEAALAYPGVALLEATSVSEGRGTDAPFLLFGAPWLDVGKMARSLCVPGFRLVRTRFTPHASPAAPEPKYDGVACVGLSVTVVDAGAAQPWTLGLTLLRALRGQTGFRWLRNGEAFDSLLGTSRVREQLERGASVEAIVERDREAVDAWRQARAASLLY